METQRSLVTSWGGGSHSQEADELGLEPKQSGRLLRPCAHLLP